MPVLVRPRALLLGLSMLVAGCAPDAAHRWDTTKGECDGPRACRDFSIEHRTYAANDGRYDYYLGFVEFDDQGWFQKREQRKAVFDALKANGRHHLVVVYVHGWKHNAREGDPDVDKFRELLENVDTLERAASQEENRAARKVFGVYVGWRGASWEVPLLQEATFWTRKNTAERVGDRSLKQFLMELDQYKKMANGKGDNDLGRPTETQVIVIGHSFGGLVVYRALHTGLIERAMRVEPVDRDRPHGPYVYDVAKSFGDFVLLVNPAFEGADYEALYHAARSRCYGPQQRPIMAIVTSKGDWATKIAFPIGRVYTWTQSAPHDGERDAVLNAVGHLDRYRTHELVPQVTTPSPPMTLTDAPPEKNIDVARAVVRQVARQPKIASNAGSSPLGTAELQATGLVPEHFPYLVVSADTSIIRDHGDIWNPRFSTVMRDFFVRRIVNPPPAPRDPPPCTPFQ